MQKKLLVVVATSVLLGLSGCGLLPEKSDETAKWSAEKLYAEAREEMAGAHYEAAIKLFQRLEANYPFGTYATQAQMEIAYAQYKAQDQAEALASVERFIKLHPNHPQVDYMYYLRGLINFNDQIGFLSVIYSQDPTERDPKATREAFAAFKALVDRFPNSKYAPDAIARMNYLINAMASYEVHVANYYYRRGAYIAAVNRAQNAVAEYGGAPAREEALFIMVRSYDKLGMLPLRDDAQRVLTLNYPNSRFLNPNAKGDAAWWQFWAKSGPKPAPKDAM
ncbi:MULTISPECIES: outer membrane protein assembly factor BamD [unclassified Massilia]|uniref:outer membrane protein assembly factor BamD n=1 Tax=unclassified Massilia TaxID=2609279 RepID=UPI00177FEAD2|nr:MULTISPECIES: outer membrane protein assembly factor BamD [unclassified Massilia]MBD8529487.1 outer membrane protein assembly factor BamD [Massilia sp. CFBP 13647]MBD8672880.1 outer membrane protein assembly factor BamD [Massilia sp. CFBP 13721]